MKRNDITLSTTYELVINEGDFVVKNSDDQNIDVLLRSTKGSVRQFPLIGAGIDSFLNGRLDSAFKYGIINAVKADGYVAKVTFGDSGSVDIKYNEYV